MAIPGFSVPKNGRAPGPEILRLEPPASERLRCLRTSGGTGSRISFHSPRIYLINMRLQDSCKGLRRLQELSFLTGFARQATVLTVVYGLGQRAPLLMVSGTQ